MNYCEDCVLLDLCGNEGCLDDALTFCDDKQKFIRRSVIEDIRAEIESKIEHGEFFDYKDSRSEAFGIALEIIDKHINGKEEEE